MFTQKEKNLLSDIVTQEKLCVDKYNKYAGQAGDDALKKLFTDIGKVESQHVQTITTMLDTGTTPPMNGGSPAYPNGNVCGNYTDTTKKDADKFLCEDTLSTEKHVSSVYDTCIFEFCDTAARDALNHIQKEEQEHGKEIYTFMSKNGMVQSC